MIPTEIFLNLPVIFPQWSSYAPAVSTNAAGRGYVWFVLSSHILWTRKRLLKYCCLSVCRIMPTNVFTSRLICVVAEQADARNTSQWRSQKAKKVTHIKGRLLDQAVILFNCVPFPNGNFSERKEFAPRGEQILPFKSSSLWHVNHLYHIRRPPLNGTILLRTCVTA